MEEVLFVNKEGRQLYLPAKTGDNLGFERVATFSPPELEKDADTGKVESDRESETEHAATVLYGVASNGYDNLSDKEKESFAFLAGHLRPFGFPTITLTEAIDFIEAWHNNGEEMTDEEYDQLKRLTVLFIDEVEGKEELTATPTPPFADVVAEIQKVLDADTRLSKKDKAVIENHLAELLAFDTSQNSTAESGESQSSINNPVEQTQPGKAGTVDAE